jgi:hypothetical protein
MVLKTDEEKERDPPGQREFELYKECQHQCTTSNFIPAASNLYLDSFKAEASSQL